MSEIPKNWHKEKIVDIIKPISLTGKKIKVRDYETEGIIPIIDQGKKLIGGYTNNLENKIKLKDVPGMKTYFRLKPPVKGFERNGIKKPFSLGGALGYRKDNINNLLRKMI